MRKRTLFVFALLVLFLQSIVAVAEEDICLDSGQSWDMKIRCKFICDYMGCMDRDELYTSSGCVRMVDRYIDKSGDLPPCIEPFDSGNEDPVINELYCYAHTQISFTMCEEDFDPSSDQLGEIDLTNGKSEYELCLLNMMVMFDICMTQVELDVSLPCYNDIQKPCYDEYDLTNDSDALSTCLAQVQDEVDACVEGQGTPYFSYPPDFFPPVIE